MRDLSEQRDLHPLVRLPTVNFMDAWMIVETMHETQTRFTATSGICEGLDRIEAAILRKVQPTPMMKEALTRGIAILDDKGRR